MLSDIYMPSTLARTLYCIDNVGRLAYGVPPMQLLPVAI